MLACVPDSRKINLLYRMGSGTQATKCETGREHGTKDRKELPHSWLGHPDSLSEMGATHSSFEARGTSRAEANGSLGAWGLGVERSPWRPFVGKVCSLVVIFVIQMTSFGEF